MDPNLRWRRPRTLCLLILLLVVAPGLAGAETPFRPPSPEEETPGEALVPEVRNATELAAELARIRSEVEALSAGLEEAKLTSRTRVQILEARKLEAESEVRRERTRTKELQRKADELKAEIDKRAKAQSTLIPALEAQTAAFERAVAETLPFQREERLSAVGEPLRKSRESLLVPADAIARLWDRVEDELRLARQSGVYQQVVRLGDEEILADVVRLGLVALYFESPDGRRGYATPDPSAESGWSWKVVSDEVGLAQLQGIFESFRQRVRVGAFRLPFPGRVSAAQGGSR